MLDADPELIAGTLKTRPGAVLLRASHSSILYRAPVSEVKDLWQFSPWDFGPFQLEFRQLLGSFNLSRDVVHTGIARNC